MLMQLEQQEQRRSGRRQQCEEGSEESQFPIRRGHYDVDFHIIALPSTKPFFYSRVTTFLDRLMHKALRLVIPVAAIAATF